MGVPRQVVGGARRVDLSAGKPDTGAMHLLSMKQVAARVSK